MLSRPDDPCDNSDCGHPLRDHDDDVVVGGVKYWPCLADDCGCVDFAQPGSTVTVGIFPNQAGDPEGN